MRVIAHIDIWRLGFDGCFYNVVMLRLLERTCCVENQICSGYETLHAAYEGRGQHMSIGGAFITSARRLARRCRRSHARSSMQSPQQQHLDGLLVADVTGRKLSVMQSWTQFLDLFERLRAPASYRDIVMLEVFQ